MAYLAKVDNAASSSDSSLKSFKLGEDGFDTSARTWGVDHMIGNNGWAYFDLPSCVALGQYLLRVEILALHSASSIGGAQFYQACAQINVSGSGSHSAVVPLEKVDFGRLGWSCLGCPDDKDQPATLLIL